MQQCRLRKMSRPGDWNCRSCNHLNFQRRDSCQRCGDPKSGERDEYRSFGSGRGGGGGGSFGFTTGPDVRPGDWYCTVGNCAAHILASRSSCFKCGASNDELSSGGGGGGFEGDMLRPLKGIRFVSGGSSSGRSGRKSGACSSSSWPAHLHNGKTVTRCEIRYPTGWVTENTRLKFFRFQVQGKQAGSVTRMAHPNSIRRIAIPNQGATMGNCAGCLTRKPRNHHKQPSQDAKESVNQPNSNSSMSSSTRDKNCTVAAKLPKNGSKPKKGKNSNNVSVAGNSLYGNTFRHNRAKKLGTIEVHNTVHPSQGRNECYAGCNKQRVQKELKRLFKSYVISTSSSNQSSSWIKLYSLGKNQEMCHICLESYICLFFVEFYIIILLVYTFVLLFHIGFTLYLCFVGCNKQRVQNELKRLLKSYVISTASSNQSSSWMKLY